jgi:hypothetical protein
MMSRIDSWHRKISASRHFQNGRHNTAQIQHCPISTTFHMWVDYDVPKWFLEWRWNQTMLNLCGIVVAILKMATGRNFSMLGINSEHHYLPTYQILRNVKRQHDSQYNCLNKIIINRLLYSVMYTMDRYCTSLYCIENPYWTRRRSRRVQYGFSIQYGFHFHSHFSF